MGYAKIETKKATVTALHPFKTSQGYGTDVYIEARSDISTVYLQVVVYDDQAETAMRILHVGDAVDVSGVLKHKRFAMKDGNTGFSMIIEKPTLFDKIKSDGRIEQIVPYQHVNQACFEPETTMQARGTYPLLNEDELPFT